jgi:hypothetical protein
MSKPEGLVARIQAEATAELNNLERLKVELQAITAKKTIADGIILRATASVLADFYNGVERTLKIILSELDGGLPKGDDWHRQLLANAKLATSIRPRIISEEVYKGLIPYLGFRHVVRNAYGYDLDLERVNKLAVNVSSVISDFQ